MNERRVGIYLCDVTPEPVTWLWAGRIPRGKLTMLDGNPGDGKTTMALDILARVTQGTPMPDGTECRRGGVVVLTAEDGLADTIRPRLEVAGADLSRALAIPYIPEEEEDRPVALPGDLPAIEEAITSVDAAVVLIDPLVAFFAGKIDANKDADVRRALSPLAAMAGRLGVAFLAVRHLNKSQTTNVLYRGGGSIGIIGAARAGLLVSRDPDNESRRVLAVTKSNLGPDPGSLAFTLEDVGGVAHLRWLGASAHSAQDLLAVPVNSDERGALSDAKDFLEEALAAGPMAAVALFKQARAVGISDTTLRRAKSALGVCSVKTGGRSGWVWEIAGQEDDFQECQGDQGNQGDHLDTCDHLGDCAGEQNELAF